jgi:hypothetical protein
MHSQEKRTAPAPNLNIQESIILRVKEVQRDDNLNDSEVRYLTNLLLDCGKKGVSFARRKTLAQEVHKSAFTAQKIEKSLKRKGYLVCFEKDGVWYRSPWVDAVKPLTEATGDDKELSAGHGMEHAETPRTAAKETESLPLTTSNPVPLAKSTPLPNGTEAVNGSADDSLPSYGQPPIKESFYEVEKELKPVQGGVINKEEYQDLIRQGTNIPTVQPPINRKTAVNAGPKPRRSVGRSKVAAPLTSLS